MTTRVKTTLLRRSGTLKMFFRLESNAPPRRWAPAPGTTRLPVGERVAPRRRTPVAEGRREDLDASPRGLDGGTGRGRHGVHTDSDGPVKLAPSEHFDQGTLA